MSDKNAHITLQADDEQTIIVESGGKPRWAIGVFKDRITCEQVETGEGYIGKMLGNSHPTPDDTADFWIELYPKKDGKENIVANVKLTRKEWEQLDTLGFEVQTTDRPEYKGAFVMAECGGY